jgi:hypothetical protein
MVFEADIIKTRKGKGERNRIGISLYEGMGRRIVPKREPLGNQGLGEERRGEFFSSGFSC